MRGSWGCWAALAVALSAVPGAAQRALSSGAANATAAPSPAPAASSGAGGDDDDFETRDVYVVVGGMGAVLVTVLLCFKTWPHLEYERAKRNNKIYPGALIVIKPASPGTAAPLVFGHRSYDLPTPADRRTQIRRAEKNKSAERALRITAMLKHEQEKAAAEAREAVPASPPPPATAAARPPPVVDYRRSSDGVGNASFFGQLAAAGPPAPAAPSKGLA